MKKYNTLGELLTDYRQHHNMSQLDLAAKIDVDSRTVQRWEKNETLIKPEKEKVFVETLNIPYQVIRNLNAVNPIAVYYDIKHRIYSLSALMIRAENAAWYKSDLPVEDERISHVANDSDTAFITDIQRMNQNKKPIKPELIKEAAKILPELNLILKDKSGFYAGHISVLPLRFSSYQKIYNREMNEGSLRFSDLDYKMDETPLVFYYYSLYADSLPHSYYLINRMLNYFKKKKFKNYIFAGITYREQKVSYLKEIGLREVWEEKISENVRRTFMEGCLDMFLFGKMQ